MKEKMKSKTGPKAKNALSEAEIKNLCQKNKAYSLLVLVTQYRNLTTTLAVSMFNFDTTGAVCQFVGPLVTAVEDYRETLMSALVDQDEAFELYNKTPFVGSENEVEVFGNPLKLTKKVVDSLRKNLNKSAERLRKGIGDTQKMVEGFLNEVGSGRRYVNKMKGLAGEIADLLGEIGTML